MNEAVIFKLKYKYHNPIKISVPSEFASEFLWFYDHKQNARSVKLNRDFRNRIERFYLNITESPQVNFDGENCFYGARTFWRRALELVSLDAEYTKTEPYNKWLDVNVDISIIRDV